VHADRQNDGTANRDFNISEDGVVTYKESKTKGTVARGEGIPLTGETGSSGSGGEKPDAAPKQ
jgi:hypothetical protein